MKKRNYKVIISFLLALFMMIPLTFGGSLVKAETVKDVTCNVRVEGVTGTITEGTASGKSVTEIVEKVLKEKKVPYNIVNSSYGKYIQSIDGLAAGKFKGYDGWLYYVKNSKEIISPDDAYTYSLKSEDNIIVYYGDSSITNAVTGITFTPNIVKENEEFKIKFTFKHMNWTTNKQEETPIKKASVTVDSLKYTTDDNGEITVKGLIKGEHSYKISGYRKDALPIVAMDKGVFTIDNVKSPSINYTDGKYIEVNNNNVIKNIQNSIDKTSKYVSQNISDSWSAVSLNKLGIKPNEKFISDSISIIEKDGLKNLTNTDLEKLIIGVTASGYTPYNFMGKNLVAELFGRDSKDFYINDAVFGMLVYNYLNDNNKYNVTKETLKDIIMKSKLSYKLNGNDIVGWTYYGDKIDPDMTGITINAISKFYNSDKNVKEAIEKAVKSLVNLQNESGYLVGNYGISSESISFAVLGLTSVGVNPEGKEFTKEKGDLVSALLSFGNSDGTFKHELKDTKGNNMSTEQALRALIAIKEFKTKGTYNYYENDVNVKELKVYTYEGKTKGTYDEKDASEETPKATVKVPTKQTETVKTLGENNNSQNNDLKLPQTGIMVDDIALFVAGFVLIVLGAGIIANRKKIKIK